MNKEVFDLIKETEMDRDLKFFFLIGAEVGEDVVADMRKIISGIYFIVYLNYFFLIHAAQITKLSNQYKNN
jgi:hypothetical protein